MLGLLELRLPRLAQPAADSVDPVSVVHHRGDGLPAEGRQEQDHRDVEPRAKPVQLQRVEGRQLLSGQLINSSFLYAVLQLMVSSTHLCIWFYPKFFCELFLLLLPSVQLLPPNYL